MKKRKMLSFILMGVFLLHATVPVVASEALTEEESMIAKLNQDDTLELLFWENLSGMMKKNMKT